MDSKKLNNTIFKETLTAYRLLYSSLGALLVGGGLGLSTGFAVIHILSRRDFNSPIDILIYAAGILTALIGYTLFNRGKLDTTIDSNGITVEMGLAKRRIAWSQVHYVKVSETGIRLFSFNRILSYLWIHSVWSVPSVNSGVELLIGNKTKARTMYLSTLRAQELAKAIRKHKSSNI